VAADTAAGDAERAPAKLNLYLHVVGRRADGLHLIDSLFAFVDLADELVLRRGGQDPLALAGPFAAAVPADTSNLVLRAVRALGERAGRAPDFTLALEKRIPVAAGLGGGSADAGAALRLAARRWGIASVDRRLHEVAAALGADIPVCLDSRSRFAAGVGEILAPPQRLPPAGIVLVNPGCALPTPDVFARRCGAFSAAARFDDAPRGADALATILRARRNDLTPAAVGCEPAIATVLTALERSPGCLLARMSGSGATCFALYEDRPAAEAAAGWLRARDRAWWIAATQLLPD
jgi:4-diphosphocytidyl-2-C-methyl-D-erythritol kinase